MNEHSDRAFIAVIVLLIAQVILFIISMGSVAAISVFCTTTGGTMPPIFTFIHFAYLGLFLFGVASLFWRRCRKLYIATISIALLALPIQVWLLDSGYLQCQRPGSPVSLLSSSSGG